MASRTSNRKLFKLDDNMPNWHHYFNYNIDAFNQGVFKIIGLSDVDFESLQNGSILKWDSKTMSWKVIYSREAT